MRYYTVSMRPGIRRLLIAACACAVSACASQPAQMPKPTSPAPASRTTPSQPASKHAAATVHVTAADIRSGIDYEYTVKRGDTLWDIASYFLKDPWKWPDIWYHNPHIHNPHRIYPGDVLKLSYDSRGRPRLSTARRVVRLSPHVSTEPLQNAVPVVPASLIRSFMHGPRIVSLETLAHAPYVLALANDELIGATGMKIYARHLPSDSPNELAVVHPGRLYRDPASGKVLGREVVHVADARVIKRGKPATLELSHSLREAHVGDRLLPELPEILADFYPRAPSKPVKGRIVAAFGGFSQIGRYQIVTLDRGARDGLKRGDVLKVEQNGRRVHDPYGGDVVQLPQRQAGLVMVFRVYPTLSYALVMRAKRPLHVDDRVRSPAMHTAG